MKLTTDFGDNTLWIYFTFQAHRSPQQGATFHRAAGMHGVPLDAAASICPDAAANCIFPSY